MEQIRADSNIMLKQLEIQERAAIRKNQNIIGVVWLSVLIMIIVFTTIMGYS